MVDGHVVTRRDGAGHDQCGRQGTSIGVTLSPTLTALYASVVAVRVRRSCESFRVGAAEADQLSRGRPEGELDLLGPRKNCETGM